MGIVPNKIYVSGFNDWGDVDTWGGVAIPISGDEAFVGNSSTDLTLRLDEQDAVVLDYLSFARSYLGSLGTTSMRLEIDATVLRFDGAGTQNWITGEFGQAFLSPAQMSANALVLTAKNTGTIGETYVDGGLVTLAADGSGAFTTIHSLALRETRLVITGGAITDLFVDGWNVEIQGGTIVNLHNAGGEVTVSGGAVTNYLSNAGNLIWVDGTITTLEARLASKVNASAISSAKTVTNLRALGTPFVDLRTGGTDLITTTNVTTVGEPIIHRDAA